MISKSRIYCEVNGSIDNTNYDIGCWKGGQLTDVGFRHQEGYGKRMYIKIHDLDDPDDVGSWGLNFDRFKDVKVYLKLGDLNLKTKEHSNMKDFILTEDNMEELKKLIEESQETA
jgi:hypothetical protein